MKRIGFLPLVLCLSFVWVAWAQQPVTKSTLGRHFVHGMANRLAKTPGATVLQSFNTQANLSYNTNIWELGTYPGGTWSATWHINDFGVIVGLGDVPPIGRDGVGSTHPLMVSLFGPHAGEWIDVGALSRKQPKGWEEPVTGISDTRLVVSHSARRDGHAHAVAWTMQTGLVDLGTLADTGELQYATYKASYAIDTNKFGTLIVGGSGPTGDENVGFPVPVVWASSNAWIDGQFVTKWKIHNLDTGAFIEFGWDVWGVNDYGQIIGVGGNGNPATIETGALWNPRPDGKGWGALMPLPQSANADTPFTDPYGINERGEIVGIVASSDWNTQLPVLWKPLDEKRMKYSDPITFPLPEGGFTSCEAVGINDLGDVVGDCWNEDGSLDLPTHWTTKNLTFSEIINFPADWGFAWGVNNNRIASITYNGENCPGDTYGSCAGAVKLH